MIVYWWDSNSKWNE